MFGNGFRIRTMLNVRLNKAAMVGPFEGVVCPRPVRPVPGGDDRVISEAC